MKDEGKRLKQPVSMVTNCICKTIVPFDAACLTAVPLAKNILGVYITKIESCYMAA